MPHLAALADLCARHPTARKVVFAPSEQAGRAARAALARAGVAYVALDVTTPAAHAREWLPPDVESTLRPLPYFAEGFLFDALLADQAQKGVAALATATTRPGALRQTIDAIRRAGIASETLRAGTAGPGPAGRQRRLALAGVLDGYENALEQGGYLDDVRALRLATAHVRKAGAPAGVVYAAFDETRLAALDEELVRALTDDGRLLHRLGFGTPGLPPARRSALALFWLDDAESEPPPKAGPGAWLGGDLPPDGARQAMAAQLRSAIDGEGRAVPGAGIRRSVGAQAEVRDALRDILARGLALDDVEVAYAANDPYLAILHAEAQLRHQAAAGQGASAERMPVTFAAGLPLGLTRFGQSLRGLLDWMEADYDTSVLVRLLQGRLLLLDRPEALSNKHAAHDLIRGGTSTGAGAHGRTLDRAELAHREAFNHDHDEEALAEALSTLGTTRAGLDLLAGHVPAAAAPPALFARGLLSVLEQFGPVDAAEVSRKGVDEVLSPDERALVIVRDRLRAFAENAPAGAAVPPQRVAAAVRDAVAEAFVGAQRPRPGHLHVVPLASAGFAGRRHLYVVGLDAQTSAPGAGEDAVLPDRDRDEIDSEGRMDRGSDRAGAQGWDFARALARVPADGSVTLCARSHDPATGDQLFPGGLLLRAADLAGLTLKDIIEGAGTLAGLAPDIVAGAVSLHDSEADLALRAHPLLPPLLERRFPVAVRGRIADECRRAPVWTKYDGWLGAAGAGLDPLATGGAVSPSRLEDLATCPYRYFVKHVLKRRPPPETLDESQLLNAAERGSLLHSVFEQFSRALRDREERPTLEHEGEILALTERLVDETLQQRGEPAAPARDALRRSMLDVARLYLLDEVRHADSTEAVAFEHGFGFDTPVPLALAEDVVVPLRGWVDRVDRRADGSYEIVDFKTGVAYRFADPGEDARKVLAGGKKLQWALYGYALRQAELWNVTHAGYRFVSAKEVAERRSYPLPPVPTVARVVRQVVAPARAGFFPQVPDPAGACKYCEVRRACGDVKRRKDEIAAAASEAVMDGGTAPALRAWSLNFKGG